ncbi:hypothetical protein J6590_039183 [Homalodisca vitripennis]|nr:hypothetical protein J6590_039183 [Homalodisca vitripennis]
MILSITNNRNFRRCRLTQLQSETKESGMQKVTIPKYRSNATLKYLFTALTVPQLKPIESTVSGLTHKSKLAFNDLAQPALYQPGSDHAAEAEAPRFISIMKPMDG